MAIHNETGKTGETLAAIFLEKNGFCILHTNWKNGRNEVDIIAQKGQTLHFVEVKTKAGSGFGSPEQRVNSAKIGRMKKAAEGYLEVNSGWKFIQFDIVAITMHEGLPEEYFFIEDIY
jgi:putative endonuclease